MNSYCNLIIHWTIVSKENYENIVSLYEINKEYGRIWG